MLENGGSGKIGKALRQIDGAFGHGLPRHFADHGLGEARNTLAAKTGSEFGYGR
jgi:hypothetical protein